MLKYKADIRTLVFVILYFVFTTIAWVVFPIMPWYINAVIVLGVCWWSFFCAVIVHNTIHTPIFRSKTANKIFQVVLSFTYGHSVSGYVAGHNLSHHQNLAGLKDISRTSKLRFKWNFLNQVLFFFITMFDILNAEKRWAQKMKKTNPKWYIQYRIELGIVLGIKFILLLINWPAALLLIFLPHGYAQWGIVGTNYWQHDGCDKDHPYNHSRNFTNPFLNFFTFNNGYHGLHHDRPTLHWSLLPEIYEKEFAPYVHPNLNRYWLSAYLWEVCIYPGKRINYLNEIISLPPKEQDKDEDWVNQTSENENLVHLGAEV
ncbi:fatty acid desaturase [Reichenbachiella sp. MALMAid0571]|uniref:fatty acid desaturase family protein n=1 Tax=Reichenbachiella sp. MALMAid0571 TaxID=3143939 RepID=UPI0032DFC92B